MFFFGLCFAIQIPEGYEFAKAGTEFIDNKVYAIGGRVLNFVNISENLKKSRVSIINEIENLGWANGFYRKDIGFRIIDK